MFVCEKCFKENYGEEPPLYRFHSYGPCEICGIFAVCTEEDTTYWRSKKKKQKCDDSSCAWCENKICGVGDFEYMQKRGCKGDNTEDCTCYEWEEDENRN